MRDVAPSGGRALRGPPSRGGGAPRHAAAPGDPGCGGPVRARGDPPDRPSGGGDPSRFTGCPRRGEGVPGPLGRRGGSQRSHGPHGDRVPGVPRLPGRGDRFAGAGRGGRPGALRQAGATQVQGRHLRVRQQLHEGRGERRGDQRVDRAALGSAGLHLLRGLPGRLPNEGDLDVGGRRRVDRRPDAVHRVRRLHHLLPRREHAGEGPRVPGLRRREVRQETLPREEDPRDLADEGRGDGGDPGRPRLLPRAWKAEGAFRRRSAEDWIPRSGNIREREDGLPWRRRCSTSPGTFAR